MYVTFIYVYNTIHVRNIHVIFSYGNYILICDYYHGYHQFTFYFHGSQQFISWFNSMWWCYTYICVYLCEHHALLHVHKCDTVIQNGVNWMNWEWSVKWSNYYQIFALYITTTVALLSIRILNSTITQGQCHRESRGGTITCLQTWFWEPPLTNSHLSCILYTW